LDGEADSKPTRNLSGYCPQAVRETFRTKGQENRNPTGRLTTAIAPTCGTKAPAPPESARQPTRRDKAQNHPLNRPRVYPGSQSPFE